MNTALIVISLLIFNFSWAQNATGESLDTTFANPTKMTDEQMNSAKDFVHKGIKDRAIKEGCSQGGLNNCQDDDGSFPVESLIGKAYALIFGGMLNGADGPSFTKKPDAAAAAQDTGTTPPTEVKEETSPDYCMYAAMAYETLGGMIQAGLQSKADQSAQASGDIQLQSLVNLKETHKARKKTANWQAGVYGAITACYAGMAYTGITLDWKYWAKIGGATTLTLLYKKKANKHSNAAKKVQTIIDSLPKSGDCNPWTGTKCFCQELTSKALFPTEYEEVCVLNNGNFDTPKAALGCGVVVDGKMQFDKECKCKQTKTCFTANLKSYSPKLEIGANLMNEANKGFDLLSNGDFDEGKIDHYANQMAAMGQRIKPKKDNTPKVNLNAEQQKIANALAPTMGSAAALAAVSPPAGPRGGIVDPPALKSSALDNLSEDKGKIAEAIKASYKSGGRGSIASSNAPDFVFPGLMAQAPKENSNTEILTFAEQAVSKADVSNAPETPIFDIISNRYRRSGWGKLQEQK